MNDQALAKDIIESLRGGQPPKRGFHLYSVGYEDLIEGIKKHHLAGIGRRGIFQFLSGNPGRGKTHLFRLIRDVALENGCLVSNVELNASDTPFNQFERVFSAIVRNIYTPALYKEDKGEAFPFERVLKEALNYLITEVKGNDHVKSISSTQYMKAQEELQKHRSINLDFRKVVQEFWKTFESGRPTDVVSERDELLQWFHGEGDERVFKKKYDINCMITGKSAQAMLKSLSGFVRLAGYSGLVILFDEGARAYQLMTRNDCKRAHNNLFGLINNVQSLDGLCLIYATTPEFFTGNDRAIMRDPAFAGRISLPKDVPPRAMQKTWNLDAQPAGLDQYKEAARKIRSLYALAHPDSKTELPSEDEIDTCVETLQQGHANHQEVSLWRAIVRILVSYLDDYHEGNPRSIEEVREDVMADIREGD